MIPRDLPKPEQGAQHRRRENRAVLVCSFCGRAQSQVLKLVAGTKVFVCDGCVAVGRELLHSDENLTFAESPHVRLWRSADLPRCSFCSKANDVLRPGEQGLVPVVTAGTNAGICGECLDLCQEIVDEEMAGR